MVPNDVYQTLNTQASTINFEEKFWPLLQYRITTDTVGQLGQVYQMAEGLEHR